MSSRTPDKQLAFNARKKALIDAGTSQRDIARSTEPPVTAALVHQVLLGDRKSARVFSALVAKLGKAVVTKLWPEAPAL